MRKIITALAAVYLLGSASCLYAADFGNRTESEYFSIFYTDKVDILDVAQKLSISASLYVYQDDSRKIVFGGDPEDILAQSIDGLFSEVSDILDMHLYSYHGDIKICSTQKELRVIFANFFKGELKSEAFYHYEANTIYITQEGLRTGVAAHEIAHAIITHYFVVLPPVKVQEVLAGYVEYNINKKLINK